MAINIRFRLWIVALCACVLLAVASGEALADRRVALVVGNSQYKNQSLVLPNPRNDAEDVAAALRDLGFEVILKMDANKRDLEAALGQFARLSTDADATLFYYAGHAMQHQGQNFLMSVELDLGG